MSTKQLGYMPDLSKISLKEFKKELKTGRLLPSRKPLLDDIETKFVCLEKEGLVNLSSLKTALSSSSKIKKLSLKTGIPENYFKLLRREINSILPTPIKFCDIPNISEKIVKRLKALNITDTETLFPT